MSTKFYTLLTDIGAAKLASAAALGVPLKITHMAVGDGGGALPTPDAKQTAGCAEYALYRPAEQQPDYC